MVFTTPSTAGLFIRDGTLYYSDPITKTTRIITRPSPPPLVSPVDITPTMPLPKEPSPMIIPPSITPSIPIAPLPPPSPPITATIISPTPPPLAFDIMAPTRVREIGLPVVTREEYKRLSPKEKKKVVIAGEEEIEEEFDIMAPTPLAVYAPGELEPFKPYPKPFKIKVKEIVEEAPRVTGEVARKIFIDVPTYPITKVTDVLRWVEEDIAEKELRRKQIEKLDPTQFMAPFVEEFILRPEALEPVVAYDPRAFPIVPVDVPEIKRIEPFLDFAPREFRVIEVADPERLAEVSVREIPGFKIRGEAAQEIMEKREGSLIEAGIFGGRLKVMEEAETYRIERVIQEEAKVVETKLLEKYNPIVEAEVRNLQERINAGELGIEEAETRLEKFISGLNPKYQKEFREILEPVLEKEQNVSKGKIEKAAKKAGITTSLALVPLVFIPMGGVAGKIAAASKIGSVTIKTIGIGRLVLSIPDLSKMVFTRDWMSMLQTGIAVTGFMIGAKIGARTVTKPEVRRAFERTRSDSQIVGRDINAIEKLKIGVRFESEFARIVSARLGLPPTNNLSVLWKSMRDRGYSIKAIQTTINPSTTADSKIIPKVIGQFIEIFNREGVLVQRISLGKQVAKIKGKVFTKDTIDDAVGILNKKGGIDFISATIEGKFKGTKFIKLKQTLSFEESRLLERMVTKEGEVVRVAGEVSPIKLTIPKKLTIKQLNLLKDLKTGKITLRDLRGVDGRVIQRLVDEVRMWGTPEYAGETILAAKVKVRKAELQKFEIEQAKGFEKVMGFKAGVKVMRDIVGRGFMEPLISRAEFLRQLKILPKKPLKPFKVEKVDRPPTISEIQRLRTEQTRQADITIREVPPKRAAPDYSRDIVLDQASMLRLKKLTAMDETLLRTPPGMDKLTEGIVGAEKPMVLTAEFAKGVAMKQMALTELGMIAEVPLLGLGLDLKLDTMVTERLFQPLELMPLEKLKFVSHLDRLTERTDFRFDARQFEGLAIAPIEKQQLVTQQELQLQQLSTSLIGLGDFTIPKITPPIIPFDFKFPETRGIPIDKDIGDPYHVYVKERGKWLKATKKPLTKKRALDKAAYITDETLSAQFKLVKAKGKTSEPRIDVPKGYFDIFGFKFRDFKVRKGERIPMKNQYIELPQFRLDSPREVQRITKARFMAEENRKGKEIQRVNKAMSDIFGF